MLRLLFERQLLHVVLLACLLVPVIFLAGSDTALKGSYLGLSTAAWFWISIAVPVAHQVYVAVWWRLELHLAWFTKRFGKAAFPVYAGGFAFLFLGRFVAIVLLAIANRGTLSMSEPVRLTLGAVIACGSGYLFYSVARYFGLRRAFGIDHFDPAYRDLPLVREGIFRFTPNAMYIFGILLLWLPGVLTSSRAAVVAALFNHLYIWVHYSCTELPDMRRIYRGQAAGADGTISRKL